MATEHPAASRREWRPGLMRGDDFDRVETFGRLRSVERNCRTALERELQTEVKRLRQGLWDCAIRTGMDNDGDETPDHLAFPDIVTLALREVERLRKDYDGALAIIPIVRKRRARFADERAERGGRDNRTDEERTLDVLLEAFYAAS